MESHTAVTPPSPSSPPAADAAVLNGDARATATRHFHVQRSNGGVSALDHDSTSSERIAAPVSELEPTATAASSMNAAVPHGATHPTARPAVDAEQYYQNLSSQAGEEPSRADVATAAVGRNGDLRRDSPQRQHRSVAHLHAETVAVEDSTPCPHRAGRHHNHHHCHRAHRRTHHSHPARARKAVVPKATTTTAAAPAADTHPRTFSQDLLLVQHSGTSDRSGSRDSSCPSSSNSGNHSTRSYDTFTADCSSATSFISLQTPVNLIDTTYQTLFSPELSRLNREAIVERIVGHRPRAYHTWAWRKARDYQELHALNIHKNSVYQQPTTAAGRSIVMEAGAGGVTTARLHAAFKVSPTASSPPPLGDVAGGVSLGSGKASLETPLPTAPSDPSSSPVARVVGLADAGEGVSDAGRCAMAESLAHTSTTAAPPPPESPPGSHFLPTTGSSDKVAGGSRLPHTSSSASIDMPCELMSQLPMYTIPTSQQGPEYFKTAAQGGNNTLIIVMMGLPARGKTFLAQKICRLLGWHGSRAKMQNIQVAWRRMLLDWEAAHPEMAACGAHAEAEQEKEQEQEASAPAREGIVADEVLSGERGASHGIPRPTGTPADEGTTTASSPAAASIAPAPPAFTRPNCLAHTSSTPAARDLATGSLNASARCAVTASLSSGSALTSSTPSATKTTAATATTANAAFTAGYGYTCTLSDTGVAAGPLTSASTSIVCLDCSASPVCPSMQAHTASSLEDSTAIPASDVASASLLSGTRFPAHAVADVTANGPRGLVARHSSTAAMSAETTSDGGGPSLEASAGASPRTAAGVDGFPPPPPEVLRTRHFRELIEQPTSVARRLYRYALQRFAEDCRLFFQHGGEVVVLNDDFITEELRQEAEALFRPLATQFFYIEVIRDAEEDPLDFVRCKIRDPMEYPLSVIDPASASDDFRERLAFLESVYETLTEAPNTKKNALQTPTARAAGAAASADIANGLDAKASVERDTGLACPPTTSPESTHHRQQSTRTRGYVKIMNSSTIETHGISGYLASRIISYVMNLSQVKIQHPIYFVLHGESHYNVEGRIGGNPPLTEQGMRDAVALLEFLDSLKRHLEHVDRVQRAHHHNQQRLRSGAAGNDEGSSTAAEASPNTASTLEMWTSQLRRAIQTTELSERLLNIRTLRWSSLNEIHAGVCEDMTYAEVKERYPLIDYFSKLNKYSFRYPEGESYQDLVIRLEPVIMELENADKVVVVVAHQAVLRCLLAYFGSTSAESSIGVEVPHRTVWRCTYDSKGIAILDELKLDSNEAGFHLPRGEGSPTASAANASSA
ncbi:6-phosphofructo-2-kinase-like protein [Leishmania infantum JPCM5]|uniref:6-phosphofructo-2-kinase-like protein n=2 Tax=Leishmania infantum TaxID=5671 RepID=A4HTA2_LEIIN|nr:6-phosphofructo-2-kinase-like protein [Leishmania infantum JPCM5]CAM65650.2 6-phosphofructo-2-kinase-like protein [Leishmania infantum JPCM5]|eukprot:XP_001463293.2 6-phosphofructo-2-kinase-like protein [Leishmania infantum JPCM5]